MGQISSFINRFKRRVSSGGLTSVEFRPEGVALAHVRSSFGAPALSQCLFLPGEGVFSHDGGLKDMVKSLGLSGGDCTLVLPPSYYRLVAVEAPDVPPQELRDAVRWKIGDLVDVPVAEAAVDAFPMPDAAQRGGNKSVFAVVAPREEIRPMLNYLDTCGLNVACIDIAELALRNLIERTDENATGVVVLALAEKQSQLMIVRNGEVYLVRPLNFSSRMLMREGNEREIAVTQLIGEIKRSLDYFEVQLRQDPLSSVAVMPIESGMDFLIERLSGSVGAEVFPVNISNLVSCEAALPDSIQHSCATAVGGALRSAGSY